MAVLEKRSDNVSINGEVAEAGFNIQASAEAFEILSDRIYPNKIKAVVRELSTNAVDATIDARKVAKIHHILKEHSGSCDIAKAIGDNETYVGKEVDLFNSLEGRYDLSDWKEQSPLVHLPNRVEPWFSIRDYGTGLSHDFIMKLYVSYFWSDKKTSNDYTGCLGLGSKSPFAYTDHFTVTSYWNGEKRMYNAHLKNGFPSISIFVDEAGEPLVFNTDEPNGVEVQFAVKAQDFDEFGNEARKLYPYFKMPLRVVGNSTVAKYLEDIQKARAAGTYFTLHGEDTIQWGFRRQSDYMYGNTGPCAIMGNIAYPISLQNTYNYDQIVQKLLRSNIDIVFPVGSLQITPSREQLSYKESTIKAIETALAQISKEIGAKLSAKIEDATTLWEARCKASELFHKGDFEGFASLLSLNKIEWKGQELGSTLHINLESMTNKKDVVVPQLIIHKFEPQSGSKARKEVSTIGLDKDIVIYEVDLPRGSFTRCQIDACSRRKPIYAIEFANAKAKVDFIDKLGMSAGTTFLGTSSLPKPSVNQRSSYANDSQIFEHNGNKYARRNYQYWTKVDPTFNLADGGVYVEMLRYKLLNAEGKEIHPEKVGEILQILSALGESNIDVIGVRRKMIKQFVRSDDWVGLMDYCINFLKIEVTKNNIAVHLANREEIRKIAHHENFELLAGHVSKLNSGKLKEFLTKLNTLNLSNTTTAVKSESKYKELALITGFKFDAEPTYSISKEVNELFAKYPMLRYPMQNDNVLTGGPDIIKYVNSIDSGNDF